MMFVCEERRGTRIRRVEEVEPSIELEQYLRDRIPESHSPFKSLNLIWSETIRLFLVDDVGLLMKGPFVWQAMPDVHIVFWDKILRGREAMCREMAQKLAEESGVSGVFTAMPKDSRATIAFAKRVGFQQASETESVVVLSMLFT